MKYQTQREKIVEWIEKGLIPKLPERDYPYQEIVSAIAMELGTNEKTVEDVLNSYIKSNKIKHLNLLVATDEQLRDYMKKQQEHKQEVDKILDPLVKGEIENG